MSKSNFTRHEIREKALQSLFPLDSTADLTKKDAIFNALQLDQQDIVNEEEDAFVPAYLDVLVGGVCDKKTEIDGIITKHLGNNWSLNRIAKMDLIILRMAIFEMNYVSNVPNTVALDEAIELTKKYSDDRSRKFVNGVLANVMKEMTEK